jgi:hypothetical protein
MSKKFIFGGSYSGVPAYDADAQAFLTATGIVDVTISNAVNTLVLDLKGGSLWGYADVILPIVGGTDSTHRVSLKDATNRVAWNGGITHDSSGVLFNGVNGYGDVSWQAPILYSRTASEFITDSTGTNNGWSGIFVGSYVFGMQLKRSGVDLQLLALGVNTLSGFISTPVAFGLRTSTVTSSAVNGGSHYAGGTLLKQQTPNNAPPINSANYFIGALNQSGSPILYNARKSNFFFFGSGLIQSEVIELNNIITTFNTAIGR